MTTAKKKKTSPAQQEMTRPGGAPVSTIDSSILIAHVNKANKDNPGYDSRLLSVGYSNCAFYDKTGAIVVCNTEGIGMRQSKPGFVTVLLSYGMTTMDFEVPEEVLRKALTGKTRELGSFIRTFGSRLESNFYGLYNIYKGSL